MLAVRIGLFAALALVGAAIAGDVCCVSTVETKETTRTCYRCKVDVVCLTCKPPCAPGEPCGKAREVRKLVKRFVKVQKLETRCLPQPR